MSGLDNGPAKMIVIQGDAIAAPLRPLVARMWVCDGDGGDDVDRPRRECVLPSGSMHVVFRLSDHPLRVFDSVATPSARTVGHAVVGGLRTGPYVRDTSQSWRSVGAQLRPGACRAVFGAPADVLAECHADLRDLWAPSSVDDARERLAAAPTAAASLASFQALLLERSDRAWSLHPAVALALHGLPAARSVASLVRESGYSHRHFIALFRESVGLAPKAYARVQRFERLLQRLKREPTSNGAMLAAMGGYADQSHLDRDFKRLSGLTPAAYRSLSPERPGHVPVSRDRPAAGAGQIRPRRRRPDARPSSLTID